MIPYLPIWILLIIALGIIVGWKIIRFAIKILAIVLLFILILGVLYFLPHLIGYCPFCD